MANTLNLKRTTTSIPISGMNHMTSHVRYQVITQIKSRITGFSATITALLVPNISQSLPTAQIERQRLSIPGNITLADPKFQQPAKIDGLIGAQLFWQLLCIGQIPLNSSRIILQKTKLGWVVAGEMLHIQPNKRATCNLTMATLNEQITRFWEIEEGPRVRHYSAEEATCESHYTKNTYRDSRSGRYIVKLPTKPNVTELGSSFARALQRLLALERTFERNPAYKRQYADFLREYELLNHMTKIDNDKRNTGYYLPHHGVTKKESVTTKLRVVFDGSARTSSGISLNDVLMVGPTIQNDLFSIVLRFRTHKYVLTADIAKMYRQILVHPEDRKYQKILWRESPHEPIKSYQLNTVTYGTASAPFLAIRSLFQLSDDYYDQYPTAASIIKTDFYVDDLLTGANSYSDAEQIRDELLHVTSRAGFHLRQWSSNEPRLINTINTTDTQSLPIGDTKKTLGIHWNPTRDTILYTVKSLQAPSRLTKRTILSQIAQLFDPLGLQGPVVVKAKLLLQTLWQLKLDWDESVPNDIHTAWLTLQGQLPLLHNIELPRRVIADNHTDVQIHGFCDASERAYGACIYVRTAHDNGYSSRLLCSKSRVAPLKTQSLPRLELCSAELLTKLMKITLSALKIKFSNITFWTDSTIVLHWLKASPSNLKTFVANRVSEIQRDTTHNQWRHVPTNDNPADILSRGLTPSDLIQSSKWRSGPPWLNESENKWPSTKLITIEIPDIRPITALLITNTFNICDRFSSFIRTQRVIAYCFRWVHKARRSSNHTGPLTVQEITIAHDHIIKQLQRQEFTTEYRSLKRDSSYARNSPLASLNPFLDTNGLIRVGGRLHNATINYSQKHPLVLPKRHHITTLIVRHYHQTHGHAGIQSTLNAIRQKYWPINGTDTVKRILKRCITCCRAKPNSPNYLMADLPMSRLTFKRPFLVTGIDYCGPFYIKEKRLRNTKQIKVYVAIFVCFATKAVHLEPVSDLTTDAFLATLRRFIARRGRPTDIHTDNATNFIGARREVREIYNLLVANEHNELVKQHLSTLNITWHNIPPRSPHFGGLWEAAVKSFKRHFTRIIGNSSLLTFESFLTCLSEIEAILNSRPITPLSTDPNDLTALTPGHFLIGDTITSIPERDLTATPTGRLSQWQQIQQIRQHFWARWHHEYLNELVVRKRWHYRQPPTINEGTVVILKEDHLPPFCWPLGRIMETHPGIDGVVRVATVKTACGEYKRSIKKLSPLPIDNT